MEEIILQIFIIFIEISLTAQELNSGCECLIYSATYGKEYGRFSSPDYPKPYPDDINCLLYTFIAGSSEVVEINIRHFDLHSYNTDCTTGDYLRVYLDLETAHLTDLTQSTGVLCSALPSIPRLLYSSGPFLVLELHTSSRPRTTNHSGFLGTFRFIDTSRYSMGGGDYGGCDYQIAESQSSGHLYSPRYPSSYPRNSRCSYTLVARERGRVRLNFLEFDLQRGDHSCLTREDVIRVHDGPGPLAPVITILCNQGGPYYEIISSKEALYLEFISTSYWPGRGFQAKYVFLPRTEIIHEERRRNKFGPAISATRSSLCEQVGAYPSVLAPVAVSVRVLESRVPSHATMSLRAGYTLVLALSAVLAVDFPKGSTCDVKLTSETSVNGSITSPGFPGPYPPKSTCQYEFIATGRQRVQLVFTDFSLFIGNQLPKDCEGIDSVIAYVILDERIEKIDSYCGVSVPRPIMSNGPRLLISFQGIHSARHARGFRAKYHFTNSFGIAGGEQVDDYPCAFRYRAKVAREGTFSSPNYPGLYPRETECHYFFHGEPHHRVRIIFHYFDVEGVNPCDATSASDYVEFSNFMGLDRKYTRQCGQIVSGMAVESEKKFFRVTFRSNDRLDATGFNATYEFVDQPTPPPTTPKPSWARRPEMHSVLLVLLIVKTMIAASR